MQNFATEWNKKRAKDVTFIAVLTRKKWRGIDAENRSNDVFYGKNDVTRQGSNTPKRGKTEDVATNYHPKLKKGHQIFISYAF